MPNDFINGLFELAGGLLFWFDVRRLLRDREIKGVAWPTRIFFALWGLWNCWYYPQLAQFWSFAGGLLLVTGNLIWVFLAWRFNKKEK